MKILGSDLSAAPNGTLTLRQVHAHAHVHAQSVSLYRLRDGQFQRLFEISNYCGYGECQHFHTLPPAGPLGGAPPTLRAGDELEFRCIFNNPDRFALGYGLSAMTEMCGPILIYTPHDASQLPKRTWHDSNHGHVRTHTSAADVGAWTVSPFKFGDSSSDFPGEGDGR